MKKKQIILSLALVLAATMNTACNDNKSKQVDLVQDQVSVEAAVETQSAEMQTVLEAKSDLDESVEELERAKTQLAEEQDLRGQIQEAMGDVDNIPSLASQLNESNVRVQALGREVILRADAVSDKRAIFTQALKNLSQEEVDQVDAEIASGQTTITEKDMLISRNTLAYEGAGELIEQLTAKIEVATDEIAMRRLEIETAVERGAPRFEMQSIHDAKIDSLIDQREADIRVMAVLTVAHGILAENIRDANAE